MKVKLKPCRKELFVKEIKANEKYGTHKERMEVHKTFMDGQVVEGQLGSPTESYVLYIQDEPYYASWFIKVGE